ncbi:MAG: type I restriction enzyme HsdR N-terminal domain-containing protein [Phycisphaerae bacterium]|nr:type I restriction enzyme HsdR N-terminal domain-containing protein [Phycisphaerae bacterium]
MTPKPDSSKPVVHARLLDSPFDGFDWRVLDDPDFHEDSVREEIVTRLLWMLGYRATSPNRIVRSKRLEHPFVALGTTEHRISLVPDYLLYADDRPAWILDAKSPRENVADPKHEAQAYSYACHRDVRVGWYAVCNGREFAAFNVGDMGRVPRIRFSLPDLREHWDAVWRSLSVETVHASTESYLKDFGIHLLKMGVTRDVELVFLKIGVPTVARVTETTYCINGAVTVDGQQYFATLDFDLQRLRQLKLVFPPDLRPRVEGILSNVGSLLKFAPDCFPWTSGILRLSAEMQENDKEHYLPLEVLRFGVR